MKLNIFAFLVGVGARRTDPGEPTFVARARGDDDTAREQMGHTAFEVALGDVALDRRAGVFVSTVWAVTFAVDSLASPVASVLQVLRAHVRPPAVERVVRVPRVAFFQSPWVAGIRRRHGRLVRGHERESS